MIDDPQSAYPPYVIAGLKTEHAAPDAAQWLAAFHQRHPELTGPAWLLAILLQRADDLAGATDALSVACDQGFYRPGVVRCHLFRMQVWFSRAALGMEQYQQQTGSAREHQMEEVIRCLEASRADARMVIAQSQNKDDVETAKEREKEITALLRKAGR